MMMEQLSAPNHPHRCSYFLATNGDNLYSRYLFLFVSVFFAIIVLVKFSLFCFVVSCFSNVILNFCRDLMTHTVKYMRAGWNLVAFHFVSHYCFKEAEYFRPRAGMTEGGGR